MFSKISWWLCLFFLSLVPLLTVMADIAFDNLGSNPIQALHIRFGDWSLRFLWLTLAVTPIQNLTKWPRLSIYRQLFGLLTFFYASLHLIAYLWVDQGFQWRTIAIDIIESRYIWFGLLAYSIIFLLAITSPKQAKQLLGKNWKKLHRYIYLASAAAIIHYYWQLKGNLVEPLFYLVLLFFLLGFRLLLRFKNKSLGKLMLPKGRL
ncbi:MAG: protein-methionine-sulfoxide reductase heme-binding subunit MsrQ [Methylococcaceae bacterium]|jgi:sulfoxide reductase heme-binding subunit YedZ